MSVSYPRYERKYLFRRFAHASNGSFNPFVITNKAAHIVNGNILEGDGDKEQVTTK